MEGLWRMHRYWRNPWGCVLAHQAVVYLYIFPYTGLPHHSIYGARLLDEYEALYADGPQKPI